MKLVDIILPHLDYMGSGQGLNEDLRYALRDLAERCARSSTEKSIRLTVKERRAIEAVLDENARLREVNHKLITYINTSLDAWLTLPHKENADG